MPADASRTLPDSRPLHSLIGWARTLLRSSWVRRARAAAVAMGRLASTPTNKQSSLIVYVGRSLSRAGSAFLPGALPAKRPLGSSSAIGRTASGR